MDDYIKTQNLYTNVTEWHEAGITGKGVHVWDMEGLTDHGKYTRERILDAAPGATVTNRPWNMSCSSKELHSEYIYDEETKENLHFQDFVAKYKPQIFSCSKGGGTESRWMWSRPIMAEARKTHNFVAFNSAGNDGTNGVKGGALPQEQAMYIAAAMMYKNDPKDIRIANYSSIGKTFEQVDFASFTGKQGHSGTSFSTPFIAGQTALLFERYGEMSQDEVYNYLKMISVPLDTADDRDLRFDFAGGFYLYDHWSGYGIPVLPHLDQRYLVFKIDSRFYKQDGKEYEMDTAPFIKDGRTFMPITFVALALKADVKWHKLTRQVEITKGKTRLLLKIGSMNYEVNGERKQFDTAPFIKDDRTFVPVSFIALELGARVAWEKNSKLVQILEMGDGE